MKTNIDRIFFACIFTLAGILIAGCDGGGLTPDQKAAANKQWNDARAGVLASLAEDQYKTGNLEKCQETLDQALALEPDNANLHLLAARLAIEQGKLDVAQSQLAQAGKLDPKNAEVDYLSGVLLQRWQQPRKACDAYAAAAAKNPAELSYLLAQAEMLVVLGEPTEALNLLKAKAPQFEHSGVIRDEIGQILVQQKQYSQAVVVLREASILAGEDDSIREHLAFALLNDREFAEAVDLFARLTRVPGNEKRADLFAALGECQSQTNQLPDAKASYESATRLAPTNGGYWLGLGKVAVQSGDLPAAESAVRKALGLDKHNAEAMCLLGYIRLKQNQLPASLAAFHAAAEQDPADSVSVCLQGYVLSRMGRAAEAKPFYSRALQINPNDELANRLMAGAVSHD
jgi:tetratricopeptide (TPR) repeat protein